MLSTLTSKAQVTVPAAIRRQLGLEPGDQLDFTLDPNGRLDVRPVKKVQKTGSISDLTEILGPPPNGRTLSLEEMDQVVADAVSDHVMGLDDGAEATA